MPFEFAFEKEPKKGVDSSYENFLEFMKRMEAELEKSADTIEANQPDIFVDSESQLNVLQAITAINAKREILAQLINKAKKEG